MSEQRQEAEAAAAERRRQSEERKQQSEEQRARDLEAREARRRQFLEAGELYEYRVVALRQTLIGDKIKTDALEEALNGYAAEGWHVRTITETSVTGRVGPGGVSGLIVVFERQVLG